MLTSIYYYNHYRPYFLKDEDGESKRIIDTRRPRDQNSNDAFSVYLNKTLKKDVINYARDVYSSIIGLKNNAKDVMSDLNSYLNKRGSDFNFDDFISDLDMDLDEFSKSFNQSFSFSSNQRHSFSMNDFSQRINFETNYYENELANIGIKRDEDGNMRHDSSVLYQLVSDGEADLYKNLNETGVYFKNLQNASNEVLSKPMANHMNFKGPTYFYNYKYDRVETDSFRLIRSGMLVDIAL